MRVNQIEEQLSNTLKAIDKFHADMEVFKKDAIENRKVVNGIMRKLDDRSKKMDKMLLKISDEQSRRFNEVLQQDKTLRIKEIDAMNKRPEWLENKA